ncbi:C39 family peptidase [Bacillus niameyensis]|uniref:C39 family peptidase n=1 Tax=Bacillus niameyensis TaxID=1522308 RepID=UPI0018A840E3|nr:C39 family peptidase [Bacillus niameyensis]
MTVLALVKLIEKYCGSVEDLTGCSLSKLEKQLLNQKPVVVWVSPLHGFTVHALILTGYDGSDYFFNDCWSNQKGVRISKDEFQFIWENQEKRAISY